jgi:hypothetical protein
MIPAHAWFISYQATLVEFDQYREKPAASCFVSYLQLGIPEQFTQLEQSVPAFGKSVRGSVVKKCILQFTQNPKVPR